MPRLIINADDFGAGPETDRGILEAFQAGVVSSASLITTGFDCVPAAALALQAGLPLGVHLNLADGFPLSGPLPGLTLSDGRFPGKLGLRNALQQEKVATPDLRRELSAQIERALALGVRPDHLDTHQHFFLFPGPRGIVIELAREFAIGAVRVPSPAEPGIEDPIGPLGEELKLYRGLTARMLRDVKAAGLRAPNGLFGMPWLNRLDQLGLESCLSQISHGDWELMVHPGYPDRSNPFSGEERRLELAVLMTVETVRMLRKYQITLMSFVDL